MPISTDSQMAADSGDCMDPSSVPSHSQELFAAALELHQKGRLDSAAELYRKVLEQDESNAMALHWYGILLHQQGDNRRAIELLGRAVAVQPTSLPLHVKLADAYRLAGDLEQSAACCRLASRLWPDSPELMYASGQTLQAMGRDAEAVEQFRLALALRPEIAGIHYNLGVALKKLGRLDEATVAFRRSVELAPDSPQARNNLAQCLLELGRPEEALEHGREAARLEPEFAPFLLNLGLILRAVGRPVEARAQILQSLRIDPDHAMAYFQLSLTLQGEGQVMEALPWLKQAIAIDPNNPTFWGNLAELHNVREEYAEAASCWERVISLVGADRAEPRISLGWSLQQSGRLAEAREHFRAAIALEPGSATPLVNLGTIEEEAGDMEGAEAFYREALRVDPSNPAPLVRLAILLRGRLPDSDLAVLEAAVANPEVVEHSRARLLFALAHVLDGRREYPRAAECLRLANEETLTLARGHRVFRQSQMEQLTRNLIDVFDAAFFARVAGCGHPSRRPVFIFGLPRSGTTLVEQVLASHPRTHGAGEMPAVRRLFHSIPEAVGRGEAPLACVSALDEAAIGRLAEGHLQFLRSLDGGRSERVLDKSLDSYVYLGLLAAMFPNATFIHCRRDARDNAVSCWMTDFRSITWTNHPEHIAAVFREYRRLMEHWEAVLPVTIHEVDYEEMVGDSEGVAHRLLEACGLDWDPACLDFHANRRHVRTASATQIRQPIYTKSVARWKNYETELADLFAALSADEPVTSPA